MEPESSLPHAQVHATCPSPKPARSSPYPHIPFPEDPSPHIDDQNFEFLENRHTNAKIFVQLPPANVVKLIWPCSREVASQKI
jgi:hypothetical protein